MPAPSQVSIINLALSHVAQKPIVAITDLSPQALAAMRIWDSSLRETLRAGTPGFATTVIALALHATYVPLHWLFVYQYPANCLAMNKVYNAGTTDPTVGEPFRELYNPVDNSKVIVTDCDGAYGEYTYLVADTNLFDSSFVTALGYRLAADLAVPLVGDKDLATQMIKLFNVAASECSRLNVYEQNTETQQKSAFLDAR